MPHLWPPGSSSGCAPIDYGPVFLRMPFGFHLTMDTLPSGAIASGRCRSALAVSGFRFVPVWASPYLPSLSGQRGITPAFGYDAPHPSVRGTLTLPNNALLSAHYDLLRLLSPTFLRISVVALYLRLRGGLGRDGARSRLFRSVLSAHPILYTPGSAPGFVRLVHPPGALAFVPVLETRRNHLHHALPASPHG